MDAEYDHVLAEIMRRAPATPLADALVAAQESQAAIEAQNLIVSAQSLSKSLPVEIAWSEPMERRSARELREWRENRDRAEGWTIHVPIRSKEVEWEEDPHPHRDHYKPFEEREEDPLWEAYYMGTPHEVLLDPPGHVLWEEIEVPFVFVPDTTREVDGWHWARMGRYSRMPKRVWSRFVSSAQH